MTVSDAIVRLRYTATAEQARRIDQRNLRDALYAAGAHKVYAIEATVKRETRARVRKLDEKVDDLTALDLWMAANEISGATAQAMRDYTAKRIEETA